jgi:Phenylacetic acid-responsive transcriptional repressor
MNKIGENILLVLLGAVAFGHSYTPEMQDRVLKAFSREWRGINGKKRKQAIDYLYRLKYVDKKGAGYDIGQLMLTEKGRLKSLDCRLNDIKNKKEKWDGKWRMVAFDIPEKYRQGRNALRDKLKSIGFRELQKSVLVAPYNCKEEIMLLVELFKLERYVRFGILEYVDNEVYLKGLYGNYIK